MNTSLLLLFTLFGCNETTHNELQDDWRLYQPDFIFDAPLGREVTWSAPDSMAGPLQAAADEWELHLSCGLKLKRVESGGELQFQCAEPQRKNYFHPDELGWEQYGLVSIASNYCENMPQFLALHAWSHQLGFAETFECSPSVESPDGVFLLTKGVKPHGWNAIETDGLRIWARQNGAPGCGTHELPWSWQKNPEIYRSHPALAEVNEMMQPPEK